jgi:hypothetical protein
MSGVVYDLDKVSNEDLLDAFESEVDGDTRSISSDPPSKTKEYREELLRRLKPFKEVAAEFLPSNDLEKTNIYPECDHRGLDGYCEHCKTEWELSA